MQTRALSIVATLFIILFVSCFIFPPSYGQEKKYPKITISSNSFSDNGMIPHNCTCLGSNRSPHISWSTLPEGTKSLALICHDPDAPGGDWVHWVLYNIPPTETALPEGLRNGSIGQSGLNSWGKKGYSGPCPPPGSGKHHYIFTVYALSEMLSIKEVPVKSKGRAVSGVTREMLENEIVDKKIAVGMIVGLYERIDDDSKTPS